MFMRGPSGQPLSLPLKAHPDSGHFIHPLGKRPRPQPGSVHPALVALQVLKIVTLKCVLPALLAVVGIASAQVLPPEEIYQKISPSVLTLQVVNSQGEHFVATGFLAFADGIAVTSWHVICDATNVTARLADNRYVAVRGLVDKDEKHDLALIRLDLAGRPKAQLNTNTPAIGSRAYVIGAPKGFEFSITDGLLSQIQKVDGYEQFQVSCPISGGDSGGPLINNRGEVIGVTSWTKRDAQNLSFATPARFLASLNPKLPAVPWNKAIPVVQPVAKVNSPAAEPVAAAQPAAPDKNVRDLKDFLQTSVGKHVTVVIIEDDAEKKFDITIPPDLFGAP